MPLHQRSLEPSLAAGRCRPRDGRLPAVCRRKTSSSACTALNSSRWCSGGRFEMSINRRLRTADDDDDAGERRRSDRSM